MQSMKQKNCISMKSNWSLKSINSVGTEHILSLNEETSKESIHYWTRKNCIEFSNH